MGVVLWIVVILLASIIALISLVLICPIQVILAAGTDPFRMKIKWLCFAVETDHATKTNTIHIFGMTIIRSAITPKPEETEEQKERKKAKKEAKKAKKQQKRAKKRAKRRKRKFGDFWGIMQDHPGTVRKWVEQAILLIFRIITALRIDYFRVNAVIATPDPYWTGMIYGYAQALRGNVLWLPRVSIDVRPDFETDRPTGSISLSATYRMWRLPWAVMRFLWALPKWGTIRMIRRFTRSSPSS